MRLHRASTFRCRNSQSIFVDDQLLLLNPSLSEPATRVMTRSPQSGLAESLAELPATSLCLTSLWLNHDLLPCHLPTAPAPMHLTSNDPLHLSMTSPALLPSHKPICKVAVFRQRHTCTGLTSGGLSSTGNLPDVQGLHLVLPTRNISMRY